MRWDHTWSPLDDEEDEDETGDDEDRDDDDEDAQMEIHFVWDIIDNPNSTDLYTLALSRKS